MASAIGVARMPTQGSCRPLVMTSVGSPAESIESRAIKIELVGFTAIAVIAHILVWAWRPWFV